ncbi:hypothetical protein IH992_13495 [Candidatus Poribacteria bacterium]|nr:hypothetical protein [Candidatus Poribacteria bacterium]
MGNETFPEESKVTLSIQQLEQIVRKVIREELMQFIAQEQSILELGKDSPLYEDMTDILDRKQSGQLKFYTHEEVWDE